jgi:hypothetical protein
MATGFVERLLTVQITAGPVSPLTPPGYVPATFGPNKGSALTLSGHKVSATIEQAGTLSLPMATIDIFGMTLSDMNAIASLSNPFYFQNENRVSLLAGDDVNGMSTVFEGQMVAAIPDFSDTPNAALSILATTGLTAALASVAPSSYPGATSVATICQQIATALGLRLENNGVTAVLSKQYLPGTLLDQLQRVTQAANVSYAFDHGVLAIWPQGQFRSSQTDIQTISPENGLVGYPSYTQFGVNFRTLFNNSLRYAANVNLKSSLQPACGTWTVYNLVHTLESITPGGAWFTDVQTSKPGFMPIITSYG